jgi:hypothetical protein
MHLPEEFIPLAPAHCPKDNSSISALEVSSAIECNSNPDATFASLAWGMLET